MAKQTQNENTDKNTITGIVKVDNDILKAKAEACSRLLQECQSLLDSLEQKMTYSSNHWNGEAADAYRKVFQSQKKSCTEHLNVLRTYPQDLLKMAQIIDTVMKETSSLVADINSFEMK